MASGNPDRRQFLGAVATIGAMAATGKSDALTINAGTGGAGVRWPKLVGSPVLDSLHPVIEHSRDVRTHVDKIAEVAQLDGLRRAAHAGLSDALRRGRRQRRRRDRLHPHR